MLTSSWINIPLITMTCKIYQTDNYTAHSSHTYCPNLSVNPMFFLLCMLYALIYWIHYPAFLNLLTLLVTWTKWWWHRCWDPVWIGLHINTFHSSLYCLWIEEQKRMIIYSRNKGIVWYLQNVKTAQTQENNTEVPTEVNHQSTSKHLLTRA